MLFHIQEIFFWFHENFEKNMLTYTIRCFPTQTDHFQQLLGLPDSLNVRVLQRPAGWPQRTGNSTSDLPAHRHRNWTSRLPSIFFHFAPWDPTAQQNNLHQCNILVHIGMTTLPRLPTFYIFPFHQRSRWFCWWNWSNLIILGVCHVFVILQMDSF